ncbi:PucR family transcriptional regulator [Parageobacillus thermoglucosidasius]|uniref:PucR family transcriptional regulator n=1 Tax=Parageobacillus thermoglucosidasius TaxID=1426 RepID=UPI000E170217|nr:helix-turn-helix domain-containing protein [Parageobacillus thermoglucosidasius]RDE30121.1 hypothetical protein DV714_04035 [Parageobacillus thermoglucosidasius]
MCCGPNQRIPYLFSFVLAKCFTQNFIHHHGELLKTLKRYIVNNCNSNLTAQDLNIHRNTLQYRLNKIKEITGKDPKNILELFELICYLLNKN